MTFDDLISIENLFQAWDEFVKGKRKKRDVLEFSRKLEDNLFKLHHRLKNKTYRHGGYEDFYVQDPKRRHIHKASVEDRIVHHLLYKYLYNIFDKTFIHDSYSCRLNKGTHKGVKRLEYFARKVSRNYTRPCWTLKLDIKKFFSSVDHKILIGLLKRKIKDKDILDLLVRVLTSFNTNDEDRSFAVAQNDNSSFQPLGLTHGKVRGIPLGNLTSQIFANIYLNELDQFVKQKLRIKYYLRYADDFIILSDNKEDISLYIDISYKFLSEELKLELHPKKIVIRNLRWGIDFLGYIVLPHYILPRTKTKKRIFKKLKDEIEKENFNQSLQSYLGYLSHAESYKLTKKLKAYLWTNVG